MKYILTLILLLCINFSKAQDLFTGALATDAETYKRIGQAPLPLGSDIPNTVDLSNYMPPAGNQSPQNSCVAWAVGYANYSYINRNKSNCNYITNNNLNASCLFSPSFIYNQINSGQNKGTYFQDAFRIMQSQGISTLKEMPYVPNNWWYQPDENALASAKNYKISSYWQLGQTGEDLFLEAKAFLAKGVPIITSVKVDDYLKRTQNFPTPYVWSYQNGNFEQMGHAILIVGYDETKQYFKFINSYGKNWGNNGYGYISYTMFKRVVNEAFIIKTKFGSEDVNNILSTESKEISVADKNAGLNFSVSSVDHQIFQFPPSPQQFSTSKMTIRGNVSIPANLGKTAQVVIYFYLNIGGQKGPFVRSYNLMTRTLTGQAATGTPVVQLRQDEPFVQPFYANMVYVDLQIPRGYPYAPIQTNLIAEPMLLIDDFPVRKGQLHQFFVRN